MAATTNIGQGDKVKPGRLGAKTRVPQCSLACHKGGHVEIEREGGKNERMLSVVQFSVWHNWVCKARCDAASRMRPLGRDRVGYLAIGTEAVDVVDARVLATRRDRGCKVNLKVGDESTEDTEGDSGDGKMGE